jgi:hypothetical protein
MKETPMADPIDSPPEACCQDEECQEGECLEDNWNEVEIPHFENGTSFRFREDEEGDIELEVNLGDDADEERVEWYARGFIDAWAHMSESFATDQVAAAILGGIAEEVETES